MIIYSVSVAIDSSLSAEWAEWMQTVHIPDVMATGHFQRYQLARILEPATKDGKIPYRIDYFCDSMDNYEAYRDHDAGELQREHTEKYAGKFVASREILHCVDV